MPTNLLAPVSPLDHKLYFSANNKQEKKNMFIDFNCKDIYNSYPPEKCCVHKKAH